MRRRKLTKNILDLAEFSSCHPVTICRLFKRKRRRRSIKAARQTSIVNRARKALAKDLIWHPSESDQILTATEVTEYLNIRRSSLYRLLKHKDIPAFRVGSDWRFSQQRIDRWRSARQK
jgi:excisionase family DNA binding protein